MGLADRDYHRAPPLDYYGPPTGAPFGGGFDSRSVTTWLIGINVAVFVLNAIVRMPYSLPVPVAIVDPAGNEYVTVRNMLFPWIEGVGHFSAYTALYKYQVWRFLTFQFLHAGLGHLLGNMLSLYFFGPIIERYLGSRRYLYFYLFCGIGGPIAYLLFMLVGVLPYNAVVPLVGASAGIFGILVAAARVAPDVRVMLLLPPVPLRLRTLAWIFVGIAVFTVFTSGNNAGGEAAHLGGAVLGFLLIRYPHVLTFRLPKRKPKYMRYDG